MYNNKRLKHMKKSEGLGDTIKKITEVTGIKRLVDILVGEDCGCEKRRKYLNEVFKYKLNPKCLDPDEIKAYENFINNRRINIKSTNYATGKISKDRITSYNVCYTKLLRLHLYCFQLACFVGFNNGRFLSHKQVALLSG